MTCPMCKHVHMSEEGCGVSVEGSLCTCGSMSDGKMPADDAGHMKMQ